MTGTKAGAVGLLRSLQEEVRGQSYFVAMHANCHRADFMLDVVGACAGMSQTMQLRRR